jgi:hypothetical protein
MAYLVQRSQDGKTFEFDDPGTVEQLVKSGQGALLSPVKVYNPEKETAYTFDDPAHATDAIRAGGLLEGSHAHRVATTGYLESAARGAAQGASLGFADELQAAIRAPFSDKSYSQLRDEYREGDSAAREANPKTMLAGELGGGLATAALPFPGLGLAKGANLAQEALFGAKLGALAGLGNSQADLTQGEFGKAAGDVVHGAEFGGVAGLGLGAATRGIGAAARATGGLVTAALDPVSQRLLALGATKKNFIGPLGDKSAKAVEIFKREGLFEKLADGSEPELSDIAAIAEAKRRSAADKLGQLFQAAGGKRVPLNDLDNALRSEFDKVIQDAPPDMRDSIGRSAENLLDDLYNTGGDLQKLWELKKRTGGWAGKAWEATGQPPPLRELFMKANSALDNTLEVETANFARQHGLPRMSELNDTYGAMSTLGRVMEDKLARGLTKDPLNAKIRDASIFSAAGGAAGGAIAGPLGYGVGAAAGGILGQSLSSTAGRLMRARIGEQLHIGQQAEQVAQGAVPRSVSGIQEFLSKNVDLLSKAFPQMSANIQQVITSPPAKAELQIRAMMPMIQPFMAHSPFSTELDGKVASPEDKLLATKMLENEKLPPSMTALRLSKLNDDGTLPPEIWAPQGDKIMSDLESFNKRLGNMGY